MLCSAGVLLVIDLAALLTIWVPISSNTVETTYTELGQICVDGLDGYAQQMGREPG